MVSRKIKRQTPKEAEEEIRRLFWGPVHTEGRQGHPNAPPTYSGRGFRYLDIVPQRTLKK